jgi:mannosyl-oligosaccharide alpha-1,2-mannosidase
MLTLDGNPEHLELAKELMYTCWQFYERNPTGIAPEIAGFDSGTVKQRGMKDFFNQAPHYLLRPETVESLMYLYRATKDPKYRDWGWAIFEVRVSTVSYLAFSNFRILESVLIV